MSQSIANKVLNSISQKGRGWVFTPRELLHLGSRATIDKALSRLASAGKIKRVARGVYLFPESNSLVGELPPSPARVAQALARARGEKAQLSEAFAANSLGLTTQVPGRIVYLTAGAPRIRRVGNTVIQFKHAAPRRLLGAGSTAGAVLQGLRFLGPEGISEQAIQKLGERLSSREKRSLQSHIALSPEWMRPIIERIVSKKRRG